MSAAVRGDRLLARLRELAAVGATPAGGVTRLAYSVEDLRGRDLVAGWMREAGLDVAVDTAGNLVGRAPGDGPCLATGSHLDSVVDAGALDGAYGAVAAVECAAALHETGERLRHPLLVVGFSNEEGARGTPGMVGSHAVAGALPDVGLLDDEGVALRDRLAVVAGPADPSWGPVAGFLELHVEQGPVLEASGVPIGVVDAITARSNVELVVTGAPRHAGTTPMTARADALVAAAHLVLGVEQLARSGAVRVATAGRVEVSPGVRNVVPGRAVVSLDLRDGSDPRLAAAVARLSVLAADVARTTGCVVEVVRGPSVPAVPMDPALIACVQAAASRLGLATQVLPSGAGHDAQVVAAAGPVAMLFVPSTGGISHAPQEATDDGHLVDGARVLLAALQEADRRLP